MRSLILSTLTMALFALGSLHFAQAQTQPPQQVASGGDKLVMGRITGSPDRHFSALSGVVKYLSGEMSSDGEVVGDVRMAQNYDQMASYLRNGTVDFISETPFAAIRLADEIGAEILVGELKKGVEVYQTYFFARTDSGIASLEDLAGKKIAFEDPGSTSAFLVPMAILKARNYQMTYLNNPRDPVPSGNVGYGFAEAEINVVSWVALKVMDVGTVSNLDWQELQRTPEKIKKDLEVIHEGPPILRSVIIIAPNMPETKKEKLKMALLAMHENENGKSALKPYKVSRFKTLDESALRSLEHTREMLSLIRDDIK